MTCTVSNSFLWSLFDILLVLHFSHFKHWLILPCDCPPPPTPPPPPPWSITHTITGFALSQHLLVIDCCCLGYGTKPGQPLLPLTFPPPPPTHPLLPLQCPHPPLHFHCISNSVVGVRFDHAGVAVAVVSSSGMSGVYTCWVWGLFDLLVTALLFCVTLPCHGPTLGWWL